MQAHSVRMGTPREALAEDCHLELISVNPSDFMPGGKLSNYEQIGFVQITDAPKGISPLDPKMKELARRNACHLGGELISIAPSGNIESANSVSGFATYVVYAKKRTNDSPESF